MARSHVFNPSSPHIERPLCSKCKTLMWLARITPEKPGFDRRTFECPQCDHSEDIVVEYGKH